MIQSLGVCNLKGDLLMFRSFREGSSREELELFIGQLIKQRSSGIDPIFQVEGNFFLHVCQGELYVICQTRGNANASTIFYLMYNLVEIWTAYLESFNEKSFKLKFVLLCELTDEVVDFGIPQITDLNILSEFVKEGGLKLDKVSNLDKLRQLTMQPTGAASWR